MASGIHCLQPNSLTSYARTSEFMNAFHSVMGDDVLREILLNAVVLIPAIPAEDSASTAAATENSSSESLFDRGNYFQLCGPPLNLLAKRFQAMNTSIATESSRSEKPALSTCPKETLVDSKARDQRPGKTRHTNSDINNKVEGSGNRSRDGSDNGLHLCPSQSNSAQDVKEQHRKDQLHPNKPIPRSNLFYCDFYTKHVGFAPHHILNISENTKEENFLTTKVNVPFSLGKKCNLLNTDVNIRLLNAMVNLWPRTPRRESIENSGIVNHNKRRTRWRRLRDNGISMCQELRRRHGQCNYSRLLDRHCPLPPNAGHSGNETETFDSKATLAHLVTLHSPVEKVCSFLSKVLSASFPNSFWGSRGVFFWFEEAFKNIVMFVPISVTSSKDLTALCAHIPYITTGTIFDRSSTQ